MRTLLLAPMLISLGAAAQSADATSSAQAQAPDTSAAAPSVSVPFGLKPQQAAQSVYSFDPPALGTYSFMLQKSVNALNALNAAGSSAGSASNPASAGAASTTAPGSSR